MSINRADSKMVGLALRVIQLIFAVIVMGTDGYGMEIEYILSINEQSSLTPWSSDPRLSSL